MPEPLPAELRQVLHGLSLNRQPGWNFPGNFLDLSFEAVGADSARVCLEAGPHCLDRDGQVHLAALAVLADVGMAAGMRDVVGLDTRMATVSMALQLTGVPRNGSLVASGRLDGFIAGLAGRQGLARADIHSDDGLVAVASGTFVALGNREGTAPLPMLRRGEREAPVLAPSDLAPDERPVYERALSALGGGDSASFIERFWDLLPRRDADGGASCEFDNGLHAGNRVGHTQGGLSFALAAVTGMAALGPEWKLVGVSAWYVSPGIGPRLHARASIVHEGRLTAVARAQILDAEGRTVLEAMTQHSRAAR